MQLTLGFETSGTTSQSCYVAKVNLQVNKSTAATHPFRRWGAENPSLQVRHCRHAGKQRSYSARPIAQRQARQSSVPDGRPNAASCMS